MTGSLSLCDFCRPDASSSSHCRAAAGLPRRLSTLLDLDVLWVSSYPTFHAHTPTPYSPKIASSRTRHFSPLPCWPAPTPTYAPPCCIHLSHLFSPLANRLPRCLTWPLHTYTYMHSPTLILGHPRVHVHVHVMHMRICTRSRAPLPTYTPPPVLAPPPRMCHTHSPHSRYSHAPLRTHLHVHMYILHVYMHMYLHMHIYSHPWARSTAPSLSSSPCPTLTCTGTPLAPLTRTARPPLPFSSRLLSR